MSTIIADSSWIRVGQVSPDALTEARVQLHHAVQIAVSATISYLPPRADDSHTALNWSAPLRSLVTEPIAGAQVFRIGLRPADLTLQLVEESGAVSRSFPLPGRTVDDGHQWIADVASAAGLDASRLTSRKHYDIPGHTVADGAPFSASAGPAFSELERYWTNAASVLAALARETAGASPVRVWPHHFDIATLISLPPGSSESRRTIGVGHSPGDEWYAEPYWYVGPYPYPSIEELPPLDVGRWHVDGWVGGALPASDYVTRLPGDQRQRVSAFIETAVRACRALLG